ncbi:hypothetical protein [Bifidobacterium aquikefiri]|uniref:hypothetical protein n=1 Tax=Bifidobacterium aquikefiri TaxID=1653207 RepID=UPI0039E922AF
MPTIGNNLLPYPNSSDAPNVPSDLSKLGQAVDTAIGGGARIFQTIADLQAVPSSQLFEGMRANVISDTTVLNNGIYVYKNAAWTRARPYLQSGTLHTSTDTNGMVAITWVPPEAGVTPAQVFVTNGPAALNSTDVNSRMFQPLFWHVDSATGGTIRFYRIDSQAWVSNVQGVTVQWLAIWI